MANNEGFAFAYGWMPYYQRILNIWPRENEGILGRKIAWFWALTIFLAVVLPQLGALLILWSGDMTKFIDSLSQGIPTNVALAKILTLQYHRKVTGKILVAISKDWMRMRPRKEFEIMMGMARISRLISTNSFTLTILLYSDFIVSQIWFLTNIKRNFDMDFRLSIGLPFVSYFPFDTSSKSIFVLLWTAQCFCGLIIAASYSGPDAFIAMILLHLCGQLRLVRYYLKNIVTEGKPKERHHYWKRLGSIISRHEEINQLASVIRETFSLILLVQMVSCTMTFGLQGYMILVTIFDDQKDPDISVTDQMFAVFFALYTIGHLFIYCYVGDILRVESTRVSDDFYESAWYKLSPEKARAFILIYHRSKIPLQLSAGGFCTFDLNLFTTVLKKSIGCVSMLLAMKQNLLNT